MNIKSIKSFVFTYILMPLVGAILYFVIHEPIIEWWHGPRNYKILCIGDFHEEATNQIYNGFWERYRERPYGPLKIDEINIEVVKLSDSGDPASAEKISAKLAEAEDTLMVIGHINSTQTKAAIPNYFKVSPPIPLILTTETNPCLVPPEFQNNEYYPILRLFPTDKVQAQTAAKFAIRSGKTVFWVVEDMVNKVYSNYLALEFIKEVQKEGKSVVLWSNDLCPPASDTFKSLGIEAVFFAGGYRQALILIRQIKKFSPDQKSMPMIILSDGCADNDLIKYGGDDVNGVYITHPMKADQFTADQFTNGGGYTLLGQEACNIVQTLIDEADNRFSDIRKKQELVTYYLEKALDIHHVHDARAVLNEVIKSSVTETAARPRRVFDSLLEKNIRSTFTRSGERTGIMFHIWQIKNGRFSESDQAHPPIRE